MAESFTAGASALGDAPNLMLYSETMLAPESMTASLPLPYEATSCGATSRSIAAPVPLPTPAAPVTPPPPPPNDPSSPPAESNTTTLPLPVSATMILSDEPASTPAGDASLAEAPTVMLWVRSALNTSVRLLPVSATRMRPMPSIAAPAGPSSAAPEAERSEPASV